MDDYIELKGKSLGNSSPSDSDLEAELNALGGRKQKTRSRKLRRRKTLKQRK